MRSPRRIAAAAHNAIKGYSKLRKEPLIKALMSYNAKQPPPAAPQAKRHQKRAAASSPKKKTKAGQSPGARPLIATSNKLVPGLSDALYPNQTVQQGAAAQFQAGYGAIQSPPKRKQPAFVNLPKRVSKPPKKLNL